MIKRKILIYTDSRGQHIPRGQSHDIFATRLAARDDLEVDLFLCPMKWTTTLDFLAQLEKTPAENYDHVILYTGIVDWSPRPQQSAISDLYNNQAPSNLGNDHLNTRDYSAKVVNNKKALFDRVFGADKMEKHLSNAFDVKFEDQPTINMYSAAMAREHLVPELAKIKNLLYINANRFVAGWKGDHARGRPDNIDAVASELSAIFRDGLGADRVIDLLTWSDEDIQRYTCDNIHLTSEGSDLIYNEIVRRLALDGVPAEKEERPAIQIKNRSILIIGNGPSTRALADFGFENLPDTIDTFGMGAAYRYFREIGWWPNYYAWCDAKVVHSHNDALTGLIEDPSVTCDRLYFSLPLSENERFEPIKHGSTGDFCFRKAVELGYKNIYIIGVEGNYVEELPESRALTEQEYEDLDFESLFPLFENIVPDREEAHRIFKEYLRIIDRTPEKNPNYFFEGYQRKGDVFSLPRSQTHRNIWRKTAKMCAQANAAVYNLSETSMIEEFPKIPFAKFAEKINQLATKDEFAPWGRPIQTPERIDAAERARLLKAVNLPEKSKLASLIIGVKFNDQDPSRRANLKYLLTWLDHYYGDLFDVLLVEQDDTSKIGDLLATAPSYVRHEFIYNPGPFNRGWGYNAAVKHFTTARVVALLDTDVLTGANFVDEIVACHTKYQAISPYTNVYFTDEHEVPGIVETHSLDKLRNIEAIAKPTTLTGGILIIRRAIFQKVAGFEQYIEYGGEDRALDVTLLNHCPEGATRMAPFTYVHLYHPKGVEVRPNPKALFAHLRENYSCRHDPSLTPDQYLHKSCKHVGKKATFRNIVRRRTSYGDLNLYRSKHPLAINGVYENAAANAQSPDLIFPPVVADLKLYEEKELYKAPPPDYHKLAALHNAFKGERCFIIGNGPSLNKHDLSLLQGEFTFAVNSIYYKTKETGFRPTFFVVEDTSVMKENIDEIRKYEAPFKFFPTLYKDLHPNADNTFFFEMNRGFYEKSSPNYCVPRFSTDASKVLYCGQSVTYINLQLAFFMGFTEVYLIGMDFSYVIPKEHQKTGDIILSTTDDPNHFHKDYFGKGKTWKDPKLERVLLNYQQAKLSYESVGRKIYNATVGGSLELFERKDYYEVLGAPSARPAGVEPLKKAQPEKVADVSAKVEEKIAVTQPKGPVQTMPPKTNPTVPKPAPQPAPGLFAGITQRPLKVFAPLLMTSGLALATAPAVFPEMGNAKYACWATALALGLGALRVSMRAWARFEAKRLLQIEREAVMQRVASKFVEAESWYTGYVSDHLDDVNTKQAHLEMKFKNHEKRGTNDLQAVRQQMDDKLNKEVQRVLKDVAAIRQDQTKSTADLSAVSGQIEDLETRLTDQLAKEVQHVLDDVAAVRQEQTQSEANLAAVSGQVEDLETRFADQLINLRDELSGLDQFADQIQTLEDNWAKQLADIQEQSSSTIAQSLGGLEQGLDEVKRHVADEIGSLRTLLQALREADAALAKKLTSDIETAKSAAEAHSVEQVAQISSSLNQLKSSLSGDVQALQSLTEALAAKDGGLAQNLSTLENKLNETVTLTTASSKKLSEAEKKASEAKEAVTDLAGRFKALGNQLPPNNLRVAQAFNRRLQTAHVNAIQREWSKRLSLTPTEENLFYMAHRVVKLEENGRGRMATTIEEALIRILTASSIAGNSLRVLEIGTLYGLGLAAIYDHCKTRFDTVKVTALDPLDGYYGKQREDITGEPVNEATFWRNMDIAGVNRDDVTLIKHLSTDDEAIAAASREQYDMLIIDGDHSYSGVKADYLHYAPMVKRGGIILFDDYNVSGWPEVTQFVDEEAEHAPNIALVGKSWRSAIFKVVRSFDEGAVAPQPAASPVTKLKTGR